MLTYSEYFQATASPFGSTPAEHNEAYNIIYGYFTAATPQQLLERLLNLFEVQAVGAIGIFVADPLLGESRLGLAHGLRKYPSPLAQHSLNMNNAFGYLDDIEGEAGELAHVNSDMLSKTTVFIVLSLGHQGITLLTWTPIANGPTSLLHGDPVPLPEPPSAIGDLRPSIRHTLSSWDVPQSTCGGPHTHPSRPPFQIEPSLTNYTKNKVLYRDLVPSFNRPPVPPGDPALTAAVTALTDHQLRLGGGLDQRRLQSVGATWGPLYTKRLLLLCGKLEEADLPPIYQAWAQKSKHKKCLAKTAYDTMISTEGNSLTLKDSLELQKIKAYIPVDRTKATTQLESYLAALATILGTHEVVTSYQQGLLRLKIQQCPYKGPLQTNNENLLSPFPDFGGDFHQFRMTQNLNWLPNVSNVVTSRLLRLPDPPQVSNAGSNGNSNNNSDHSSSSGVRTSPGTPAQARMANPNLDTHLRDSNHSIVKKLDASIMREAIQAMRDNGKGSLSQSDGQETSFSSCKDLYAHMAITSSKQDQLWEWCQEAYA
eukprot:jgi/Psemu1/55221/gm1.55221_g